jgi:hypothetical protein
MSEKQPQFNFGDIVKVNGYYPRLFEIDGRRTEHWQYANEDWTDVIYEVYDVVSCDWIECAEEDITLVVEAAQAEEYLAANPPDYEAPAPTYPDWVTDVMQNFGKGAIEMAKPERKPTAKELSAMEADRRKAERKERGEQIDNLLDLRNWAAGMLEKTGNEAYGDRVFAIDCELKKLVETE